MKKFIFALLLPLYLLAYDATPRCLYDIEINFLEPRYVKQSFDIFRVFQSQWDSILVDLRSNAQYIPRIVRERARAFQPDPTQNPFDGEKIKEIVLAVEFEVFRDVMNRHYFYDLSAIYGMFDYIKSKQEKRLDLCLGLPKKKEQPIK